MALSVLVLVFLLLALLAALEVIAFRRRRVRSLAAAVEELRKEASNSTVEIATAAIPEPPPATSADDQAAALAPSAPSEPVATPVPSSTACYCGRGRDAKHDELVPRGTLYHRSTLCVAVGVGVGLRSAHHLIRVLEHPDVRLEAVAGSPHLLIVHPRRPRT